MLSDSPSFLFETQAKELILRKVQFLKEEVSSALQGLSGAQVVNLVVVIMESLENFKHSSAGKACDSSMTSLDLLREYCYDIADLIDSDIDALGLPEEVNELQLFGAFAYFRYTYALRCMEGLVPEEAVRLYGGEETASLVLAIEAVLDASLAMVVGYSEFKRSNGHLSNVEKQRAIALGDRERASKGGLGKSEKNDPLRDMANSLYREALDRRNGAVSEYAAGNDLEAAIGEKAAKLDLSPPDSNTIRRWLRKAEIKKKWEVDSANSRESAKEK